MLRYQKRYVPHRIGFWNAQLPMWTDCSAGQPHFLEQNLVIILSDLRLGCLSQTKTIWSIPDPVWCEQLHSEPIRYDSISPSIVHIVSDRFPNRPKNCSVNMAWIVHYFVEWGKITRCDLSRRFFCIDATLLVTTLQCPASKKHLLASADTWYGSSIPESNVI